MVVVPIVDARFFTDRFITKPAVWGYQKNQKKETDSLTIHLGSDAG